MKKLLTILTALMVAVCLTVTAYAAEETLSGTCGPALTWTLDEEGTLTISGTGPMDTYTASADVPWNDYRSDIVNVVVDRGVTTIGNYAFYYCSNLTCAVLPDGITDIGGRAFYYCRKLASVNIPQGVITIGYDAFSQCDALPVLEIPDSVTTIGRWAFAGSDSLTRMVIPDSVVELGECAFWWCDRLEEVVIGNGVTEIGNFTFYNDISLQSVTLGKGVKTVCSDVFEGCTELKQVTFKGDAPSFEGDTVFLNVAASCYYPMGNTTWTEAVMQQYGGTLKWIPFTAIEATVTRIAGEDRCKTAVEAAKALQTQLEVERVDAVIIASGSNFADALAGSYLAAVKSAPILLYLGDKSATLNEGYITENLAADGIVYILGGESAVPPAVEESLTGLGVEVKRLAGPNRFDTNLAILEEAGVESGGEVLVATGFNFADSLSASAAGKPILLVNQQGTLTEDQQDYLSGLSGCSFTILGGTSAVAESMEDVLSAYGHVERLAGKNRYDTSVLVAETYFPDAATVVIAYGGNFPDGLSGGPVAYAMGAPLLLTQAGSEGFAAKYVRDHRVTGGYVLGGTNAITEATVKAIFSQ